MDEAIPSGEPGEPEELSSPRECTDRECTDEEGTLPLGVGVVPTGHAEVDAQLRRLEDADHLAVSGHLEVYEDVHRGLRSTLTALDQHNPGS
ncbi:hypothetical protein [Streptomyces gobiensis]|uniref:hypothetical protein n=1 Tax=Streptomyces gobiensis TaxID=2875706 RepID=UPI001E57A5A7|nr:hypothetical protein [Streptomyces gobiensis]UGY90617.1 hypothetical protein test1122_02020 [Streptomyces gobiensis]